MLIPTSFVAKILKPGTREATPSQKGWPRLAVNGVVLGKIRWDLVYGSSVPPPPFLHNNTNILSLKLKTHWLLFLSHFIVLMPCGGAAMNGRQANLI